MKCVFTISLLVTIFVAAASANYTPRCRVSSFKLGKIIVKGKEISSTSKFYVTYLTYVKYKCRNGYRLSGESIRQCQRNGRLTGKEPTCVKKVKCFAPPAPFNGSKKPSNNDPISIGDKVRFYCEPGYRLIGEESIICLPSGEFSDEVPICHRERCRVPMAPENGGVTPSEGYIYEDQYVTYHCISGFVLSNTGKRRCLSNGQLSEEASLCLRLTRRCIAPDPPVNGNVDPSFGLIVVDDVAVYSCGEGFTLVGTEIRKCQSNGQLSGSPPTCEPKPKPCRRPGKKMGGVGSTDVFYSPSNGPYYDGMVVTISCRYKFAINKGTKKITCQNGEWYPIPRPDCDYERYVPHDDFDNKYLNLW